MVTIKQMERETEFLSLDFFSLLYAVKKKYLRYGMVVRTFRNTQETKLIPAVFIDKLPIFIDILNNRIREMLSNDNRQYTPYLCDFRIDEEKRKVYFTHSGENTLEIACDLGELHRVYRYSYFSEDNYKMMVGGFSNVRKPQVKQAQ
jgi:hypothetical protein